MQVGMLLEMAADGAPDRIAVGSRYHGGWTARDVLDRAAGAAALIATQRAERLVVVDVNSEAIPVALFAASLAGVPYAPISYRLADERLRELLERVAPAIVVVEDGNEGRVAGIDGIEAVTRKSFLEGALHAPARPPAYIDPDDVAVLLFTSGTTGQPKAAVLRHRHLASYVIGTVEFLGAQADEATLVSVPPYHIAGVSAVLSSAYAGRRIVYLPEFSPESWIKAAREEAITHAMVVPTMLVRIVSALEEEGGGLPALRHLSYGGGRMPVPALERALALLPDANFVNAYGLTETSSTIAVLTPEDHRTAFASQDPEVRARLSSVGRPLPTLDVDIRGPHGERIPGPGVGEVWVRGDQVSGEYLDANRATGDDGWFRTRDRGRLDEDGYLYLGGRLDDVIVRGGENLAPGEIEDVLVDHSAVAEAAVIGVPDEEWGEAIVAVVVLRKDADASEAELQAWVRDRLRSARTPARIEFRRALPYTETGKLLRRVLRAEATQADPTSRGR